MGGRLRKPRWEWLGQNPASASSSCEVNTGSVTEIAVDGDDAVVVIGYLPGPAETLDWWFPFAGCDGTAS
jgi:hypothetical protein